MFYFEINTPGKRVTRLNAAGMTVSRVFLYQLKHRDARETRCSQKKIGEPPEVKGSGAADVPPTCLSSASEVGCVLALR